MTCLTFSPLPLFVLFSSIHFLPPRPIINVSPTAATTTHPFPFTQAPKDQPTTFLQQICVFLPFFCHLELMEDNSGHNNATSCSISCPTSDAKKVTVWHWPPRTSVVPKRRYPTLAPTSDCQQPPTNSAVATLFIAPYSLKIQLSIFPFAQPRSPLTFNVLLQARTTSQ